MSGKSRALWLHGAQRSLRTNLVDLVLLPTGQARWHLLNRPRVRRKATEVDLQLEVGARSLCQPRPHRVDEITHFRLTLALAEHPLSDLVQQQPVPDTRLLQLHPLLSRRRCLGMDHQERGLTVLEDRAVRVTVAPVARTVIRRQRKTSIINSSTRDLHVTLIDIMQTRNFAVPVSLLPRRCCNLRSSLILLNNNNSTSSREEAAHKANLHCLPLRLDCNTITACQMRGFCHLRPIRPLSFSSSSRSTRDRRACLSRLTCLICNLSNITRRGAV